jgi:hypothetical protein
MQNAHWGHNKLFYAPKPRSSKHKGRTRTNYIVVNCRLTSKPSVGIETSWAFGLKLIWVEADFNAPTCITRVRACLFAAKSKSRAGTTPLPQQHLMNFDESPK